MIQLRTGNLLESQAEALVNTVNTVGVMGKGIALQFRQAFPENYRAYRAACAAGEVEPGRIFTVPLDGLSGPRFVFNFPTKRHWRSPSRLEDIDQGLEALTREVSNRGIRSIAIPPLGCGNGGLDWREVRPLIERAFASIPTVTVELYEPKGAPIPAVMPIATERPKWTRARALLVLLMDSYRVLDEALTKLEIQKLAYFLQEAGEPLRLSFRKDRFGPYAENLNHVLLRIEGHFIRGYGDRTGPAEIRPLPGAVAEARALLGGNPVAAERLARVRQVIEGFESPYGLELLATIDWIANEFPRARVELDEVQFRIGQWSAEKQRRLKPEHVEVAWRHLSNLGWLLRDFPMPQAGGSHTMP